MPLCPGRSVLTSLIQHLHTERPSWGSEAQVHQITLLMGEIKGDTCPPVSGGVAQWSNGSPAEGLLCSDAIITTTLPLSIYSSQSSLSPSLSVSLSDSPYSVPKALKGEGQKKTNQQLVFSNSGRNTAPVPDFSAIAKFIYPCI